MGTSLRSFFNVVLDLVFSFSCADLVELGCGVAWFAPDVSDTFCVVSGCVVLLCCFW